ncbi:hypothetical protein PoB_007672100 [Plakobranchus ocellatus]|uniref:Uncharacterized protein n=1 Tax=Plakobranchus ocellatus TaxID=259542 RepID=A0AAV4E2E9_9GAST|nr:hypothetical protein PoB_007672100 [Plakobranchus ocellatus]
MKTLQEENTSLKQQLLGVSAKPEQTRSKSRRSLHTEMPPSSTPDMVYDFSGLSSDVNPPQQEKQKSTRRFPLSLASPLNIRKKLNDTGQGKGKSGSSSSGPTNVPAQSQALQSLLLMQFMLFVLCIAKTLSKMRKIKSFAEE